MAFNFNYVAPFLVVALVCFADVFCADGSVATQKQPTPIGTNPWQKGPINEPLPEGIDSKSTTPWPELGQKRPKPNERRDYVAPNPQPKPTNQGEFVAPNPQNNQPKPTNQRDFVAPPKPSNKPPLNRQQTYIVDFIAGEKQGGSIANPQRYNNNNPSNTRDYVAPPRPINNPTPNAANIKPTNQGGINVANTQTSSQGGKTNLRDYVAPNIPNQKQTTPASNTPQNNQAVSKQQNSGVRDYVAPSNPKIPPPIPPKPTGQTSKRPEFPSLPNAQNTPPPVPTWVRPTQPTVMKPIVAGKPIIPPKPNVLPVGPGTTNAPTSTAPKEKLSEDDELREFSEALIKKDVNNAAKYVDINYQGKTRSGSLNDEAPQPLLKINEEAYKLPSVAKLIQLHNNYILESNTNEVYTAQEKIEENNFLDTILPSPVMQHTRNFLVQKGKIPKDPKDFRDLLKTIWFNMYSRGGGKIGSSGFEHVFLAEIKNEGISGLHNWVYFNDVENKNVANYLGYMKKLEFEKGAIVKYHFNMKNIDKPVGSMFIGTSPEFELALYSTCFIMRPDAVCPMRLGGKNFVIRTYTYRYRGKNMIGSAFPEI